MDEQELPRTKRYNRVRSELNWFYNDSSAALGYHSNFSNFLSAVYGTSVAIIDPDPYTDGLLLQIKKYRRIHTLLTSLSYETRCILRACYDKEYQYPPELLLLYGAKCGCVIYSTKIKTGDKLLELCTKKRKSKLTDQEKILMFQVGDEAQKLWEKVHEEYLKHWKSK